MSLNGLVCKMRLRSSPTIRFSRKLDQRWTATLTSPGMTESLGRAIGRNLQGGEIVLLIGELGVGKTVLVRGLAQGCGIPAGSVCSPTFTLIQEYEGDHHLIHADLYRLEKTADITNLGLADLFDGIKVVIVEWADRLPRIQLPADHLTIQMMHRGRQSRSVSLTATGPASSRLCQQVIRNVQDADGSGSHRPGKSPS